MQIPESELEIRAIRSGGPGGQKVNKVATAIQLRFDIIKSSLPSELKAALLELNDRRINAAGVLVITARQYRTREANRLAALERLEKLLAKAGKKPKTRRATRPTRSSIEKRLQSKTRRSRAKQLRRQIQLPND